MKKTKVKIPGSKANEFAEYCFSNEIRVLLSWGNEDFFGNLYIFALLAIPEAKEADFLTQYKTFIVA
jgi:hypothetical protein